jgi:hypothetical protein
VKTNSAVKTRADANMGLANSKYSHWSWSKSSELPVPIWIEFMFVNNGTKLAIISGRNSGQK